MKVVVLGDDDAVVRRALDQGHRRGIVESYITLPAGTSVGDLATAARQSDVIVAGRTGAQATTRVPFAALVSGKAAVVPSWPASEHRDHLALAEDAKETGVTIVTGASASPAISAMLARHAARGLDEVRDVEVAWAVPAAALADHAYAPALHEGGGRAVLMRADGTYRFERSGRAVAVAFPDPVGVRRAGTFGGAEAWSLAEALPGQPTVRVSMASPPPLLAAVPGAAQLAARWPAWGGEWAGLRVSVEGRQGTRAIARVVGGFDTLDNWDTASLLLGLETAAAAPGPGVFVAGEEKTPVAALALCHDLGIRFAAFDPAA